MNGRRADEVVDGRRRDDSAFEVIVFTRIEVDRVEFCERLHLEFCERLHLEFCAVVVILVCLLVELGPLIIRHCSVVDEVISRVFGCQRRLALRVH